MTMHRTLTAMAFGLSLALGMAAPGFAAAVRITVNDTPISDVQIAQRAKLMKLEHHPGNLTTEAENELINEALELQEGKRLGINVTSDQVDAAYLNIARNLRISPDKLTQVLIANGVGVDTLRQRLKASLVFNQITVNIITPRVTFSEADLAKEAAAKATPANSFDYILKQITFIGASPRFADANRYRAQFKGCDSAVKLSESYRDVAVTDVGRRHATQLPLPLATELGKLPVGGLTRPQKAQDGISMLAICSKEQARDLTFITNKLRQTAGNDELKVQTDKYLAELRAKAKIVRR